LICNNCTYSCNHCGNKIEDLAILTGDQAFCANCFRCRNCKRKIENLRYARTSQGIFCMSCHESLMARRRKKSKKPPSSAGGVPKVDKSLPALPPSAAPPTTFTPDLDTPSDVFSEPPTADTSPRPPHPRRNDSSPANFRRDASPESLDSHKGMLHNLTYHYQRKRFLTTALLQTIPHCFQPHIKRQFNRKETTTETTVHYCTLPSTRIPLQVPHHSPSRATRVLMGRLDAITSTGLQGTTGKC